MNIRSDAIILGDSLGSVFPRPYSPSYIYTDKPWETNPVNMLANGGFLFLPSCELGMPAPFRVPHNQSSTQFPSQPGQSTKLYPSVDWNLNFINGGTPTSPGPTPPPPVLRYAISYPYLFTEVGLENWDDSTVQSFIATCKTNCQGFSFIFRRSDSANMNNVGGEDPGPDGNGVEQTADNVRFELRWRLGNAGSSSDAQVGFALTFGGNGEILMQQFDTVTLKYSPIATTNSTENTFDTTWGNYATSADYTIIEVLMAGGKMLIKNGSQAIPVVLPAAFFDDNGDPISTIAQVEVSSNDHKTIYWSVHPTKFYASSSYQSVQIPTGFMAADDPSWSVTPSGGSSSLDSSGVQINITSVPTDDGSDSLLGPTVQYELDMLLPQTGTYQGLPYADFAPGVHAVTLQWARGPLIGQYTPPAALQPESMDVELRFDMDTLQIRSSGQMVFNNNNAYWGPWMQNTGQGAVTISLGRTALGGGSNGQVLYNTVFTGIGHTQGDINSARGGSKFTMSLQDRVRELMTPRWALPWMDGWNSIYAIAFLAQLGGVPIEQMNFRDFVPDNPFEDWGDGSTFGLGATGAYFLPVGYMSSDLTRFSGISLWEVMSKIAYSIGYMLYFDRFGFLSFEKFNLPFLSQYLITKRTFYESDRESASGAEGCWDIGIGKNMDTVRNKVVIVGINSFSPLYEPIVFALTDDGSILDPTSPNYLGYIDPVVWADSQFGDPQFAWDACQALMAFLRMPERRVRLTTWFQPDMYPLDIIQVSSVHSGSIGIQFMVVAVKHHLDQVDHVGRTTIEAIAMTPLGLPVGDTGVLVG